MARSTKQADQSFLNHLKDKLRHQADFHLEREQNPMKKAEMLERITAAFQKVVSAQETLGWPKASRPKPGR